MFKSLRSMENSGDYSDISERVRAIFSQAEVQEAESFHQLWVIYCNAYGPIFPGLLLSNVTELNRSANITVNNHMVGVPMREMDLVKAAGIASVTRKFLENLDLESFRAKFIHAHNLGKDRLLVKVWRSMSAEKSDDQICAELGVNRKQLDTVKYKIRLISESYHFMPGTRELGKLWLIDLEDGES